MLAKHFLDDPNQAVLDSLRSLSITNPSLLVDESNKIVYRSHSSLSSPQNVSVVCGGGSGHEPGFSAFVGNGLLTACVCGTIFASPSADQIRKCLLQRQPAESKGILVIVTNYTGDVLNFGMAVEKARAKGKNVEMVIVGDDVGVGRAKSGKVGRRGLSGTALVVKVCGALAEMGVDLRECARVGRLVAENTLSLGASLSRVHVPGRGVEEAEEESRRLGAGLVEIGMGVHNEPGCEKAITNLTGLLSKMLAQMLDCNDKDRSYVEFQDSDQTVLLINNFGGVSNLELGAITTEVVRQLKKQYSIKPVRIITGTIFGSLNGPGFGLSILKLTDTGLGPGKSMVELIDAPAEATGWSAQIQSKTWESEHSPVQELQDLDEKQEIPSNLRIKPQMFEKVLESGLQRLIAVEKDVTRYDSVVGDGDCGIGLKRGADAILQWMKSISLPDDVILNVVTIIQIVERTMDGTSGALYAIFLNSLAHNLRLQDSSSETLITADIWSKSLALSLAALGKYTPAQPGDRTLIDALFPFIDVLQKTGDVKAAAAAAKKGADSTQGMKASLGRSVYVGGRGYEEVPDPGAYALSEFFTGLAEAL